jgi:hypothetical protein
MHVLFLALTIYLIGTTVVLYVRPTVMFHPGGAWKEFSLNPDDNHTYMPFWLFSILWALFSYLVATFIQRMSAGRPETDDFERIELPMELEPTAESTVEPEMNLDDIAEPVSKNMGLNKTRNGFYVLNTNKYNKSRVPTYVYYGDKPPNHFPLA